VSLDDKELREFQSQLDDMRDIGPRIAAEAAPIIEAKYRSDATNHLGHVPALSVTPSGSAVSIDAPEWSLELADKKGQIDEWVDILADVGERLMSEGKK
jgi:hypothetical protein